MARYGLFVLTMLIGLGGIFAAYCRSQKHMRCEDQKHSAWDFVLLWPFLLEKKSADTASRQRRLLTTREIVGWVVVLVLIVVAVVFGW